MQQNSWSQQVAAEKTLAGSTCVSHPWNYTPHPGVLHFPSQLHPSYWSPGVQLQGFKQPATSSIQILETKASTGFPLPLVACKRHHLQVFALSFHCVYPQILSQNLCPKLKKKNQTSSCSHRKGPGRKSQCWTTPFFCNL